MAKRTSKCKHDLVGKVFGYWTVLGLSENQDNTYGDTRWTCKCRCGAIKDVLGNPLLRGDSKSCGCYKHNRLNRNLIGNVFGRWTVIDGPHIVYKYNRQYRQWLCECKCGTIRYVDEPSLVRKTSTLCGCLRKERARKSNVRESLVGQKFSHLLVLEELPSKKFPGGGYAQMWKCRCDCGKIHIASGNLMKAGLVKSCGCTKESNLESLTKNVLSSLTLKCVEQYSFSDLYGKNGGLLKFDFAVFDAHNKFLFLIECQGEQHYRVVKYFGGEEGFAYRCFNDDRKRAYCKEHGYPLLEISYKEDSFGLIRDCVSNFISTVEE